MLQLHWLNVDYNIADFHNGNPHKRRIDQDSSSGIIGEQDIDSTKRRKTDDASSRPFNDSHDSHDHATSGLQPSLWQIISFRDDMMGSDVRHPAITPAADNTPTTGNH